MQKGAYQLFYRPEVLAQDLPQVPRNLQERIVRAIETRLATEPTRYGTRLRRSLSSLWKLRVGHYRVVYEVEPGAVRVWLIAHRRIAYREAGRRWKG